MLCLSGLALAPAVASAQANLYAERVGDMIQVDVSAVWNLLPVEWVGLVVQRGYDIDFGAVDPATYSSCVSLFVSGIPVDIYGRIEVSGMIPNVRIVASQVLPTPSGLCGPLPVKSTSWGQVKTGYR